MHCSTDKASVQLWYFKQIASYLQCYLQKHKRGGRNWEYKFMVRKSKFMSVGYDLQYTHKSTLWNVLLHLNGISKNMTRLQKNENWNVTTELLQTFFTVVWLISTYCFSTGMIINDNLNGWSFKSRLSKKKLLELVGGVFMEEIVLEFLISVFSQILS